MWLVWSQCCHCNVCLPIALWGGKKHLPVLSLQLQCINGITLPTPFSLSSVTIYLLSHFFLWCPDLIYPFYLPAVFAAISSLLCLSLILVSPGFLSPGEEGKRFQEEAKSARRSGMTQKLYHRERLMVTSHLVLKTYEYYAYLSVRQVIHPRHLINAIHAKWIPQMTPISKCVICLCTTHCNNVTLWF